MKNVKSERNIHQPGLPIAILLITGVLAEKGNENGLTGFYARGCTEQCAKDTGCL